MNTDLVGAAGLKTKRDKAVPICFFYHFIMGDCIFSMFPVYGSFDDGSVLAPERSWMVPSEGVTEPRTIARYSR